MPIAETELAKPTNAHVLRPADESVYKALHAWRHAADRQEWWWLIIDHGNQRYTAIRVDRLRDALMRANLGVTMETRLSDLPPQRDNPHDWEHPYPGVVTPTVVEQDSVGTARAHQMLQDSPGRVLVVLHNGQFRGILSAAERTFAFADKPLLDMLDEFEQRDSGSETIIIPNSDPPAPPVVPPE
jgi:hypothetical protein